MDALAERLKAHLADHNTEAPKGSGADCCVAARTQRLLDQIVAALATRGVDTHSISRNAPDAPEQPGVRLATLHRVKELKFREMHIACVNDGGGPREAHRPNGRLGGEPPQRALSLTASHEKARAPPVASPGKGSATLSATRGKGRR